MDTGSEVKGRKRSIPRPSEPIWQFIIIGAVALFIEIIIRRPPGLLGIDGGPDRYWALHWVRDYSNGFERRALLGEIQRLLYIDPSDYRIITLFSWVSSIALYVTVVAAILKMLDGIQVPIRLALVAIVLISPATTGLIVETTGDPLQLLLTVYFALICFVFGCWREPLSSSAITATIFGGFAIASTLVHEANIFFTLPSTLIIAFWRKSKPAFAALISHSLGAGLTAVFVLWATERPDAVSSMPLLHIGSETIVSGDALFPSFSYLLADETNRLFGQGAYGYFVWSSILTSSLLLPIFLIYLFISACGASIEGNRLRVAVLLLITAAAPASLAPYSLVRAIGYLACFYLLPAVLIFTVAASCLVNRTSKLGCSRLFPIFVVLLLFSAPVYAAHDWGRFISYSFFSSMILCSMSRETSELKLSSISSLAISPLIGAGLIIAGLTATPLLGAYRFQGLYQVRPIFIAVSVIIAVALLLKECDWAGGKRREISLGDRVK
jgi:hypothetical protein